MNDSCVILAMAAIVGSGLGAGGAGAYEFNSERVVFMDPIRPPNSVGGNSATQRPALPAAINEGKVENYGDVARDRTTGSVMIDSQYVRKRFIWPWASSPTQDSPMGETQRSRGNRSGGNGGGSGSSGSSGSGNMGSGSSTGGSTGNMGSGSSTGSPGGSGNMGK
ncbi:hypothetical protein QD460_00155 [Rhizobium jaguaris]|uniref:hypothetical protein n=1 Tax=Rhizobium jaguaris TaxID=1312183 RepID=UPI0039BF8087